MYLKVVAADTIDSVVGCSQSNVFKAKLTRVSVDFEGSEDTVFRKGKPGEPEKDLTPGFDPELADRVYTPELLALYTNVLQTFGDEYIDVLNQRERNNTKVGGGDLRPLKERGVDLSPLKANKNRHPLKGGAVTSGPCVVGRMVGHRQRGEGIATLECAEDTKPGIKYTAAVVQDNLRKHINEEGIQIPMKFRPPGIHRVIRSMVGHLEGEEGTINTFENLLDIVTYVFHNYEAHIERGQPLRFYIPKLEYPEEGALIRKVLSFLMKELEIPAGFMKATIMIETFPAIARTKELIAAFGPDKNDDNNPNEDFCENINYGRWDAVFSFIKTFGNIEGADGPKFKFPDRNQMSILLEYFGNIYQKLSNNAHEAGKGMEGGMACQAFSQDPAERKIQLIAVIIDKVKERIRRCDNAWAMNCNKDISRIYGVIFGDDDAALLALVTEEFPEIEEQEPELIKELRAYLALSSEERLAPQGPISLEQLMDFPSVEPGNDPTLENFEANIHDAFFYAVALTLNIGALVKGEGVNRQMLDIAMMEIDMAMAMNRCRWRADVLDSDGKSVPVSKEIVEAAITKATEKILALFREGNAPGFEDIRDHDGMLAKVEERITFVKKAMTYAMGQASQGKKVPFFESLIQVFTLTKNDIERDQYSETMVKCDVFARTAQYTRELQG
ncbi:MAG: hypothetical protein HRT90_05335 [Candidatus Margulisbacteria bacterium]|nr:hypothetical protein [Candidatus Margulisiibacteriota bacterium]